MNRRLYRSRTDTILGGVAAGVANYLDADPALVRIAWAVLIPLTGGLAFIAYIVGWIVVPEAPVDGSAAAGSSPDGADATDAGTAGAAVAPASAPSARRSSDGAGIWVGIGLILLGGWFLLRQYLPEIDWSYVWPLLIVGVGVMILVGATRRKG